MASSVENSEISWASSSTSTYEEKDLHISNEQKIQKFSDKKYEDCLKHSYVNGRHYVACIPCSSHIDVVKFFLPSQNKRLPAITQVPGTKYRKEIVAEHLKTNYHVQALKKFHLSTLSLPEKLQASEIVQSISKQNEEVANKIGKLLFHVYCDAKKLTLSAWSFPARVFAAHLGENFHFNSTDLENTEKFNFQYVTPVSHLELLKSIVNSYRSTFFKDLLENSLALSLRCDGSVDRMQIDKIYVMAKVVTKDGDTKDFFLGAAEPQSNGAAGLLEAVKSACNNTLASSTAADQIFKATSSLVTDGASVNTGEKNGLWAIFKKEKASNTPFITIGCAVHRSNLAWKRVTKDVKEVNHLIMNFLLFSMNLQFVHEN